MAFLFYIDDQLTDQPDNDTSLATTIKRDSTLGALLVTQDASLIYSKNDSLEPNTISGYAYLKQLFEGNLCDQADILIIDQVTPVLSYEIYRGVIKVPSMIFNEQTFSVTTTVQDNSFYSYINNNKNIKFNLKSTSTKSQELIEPPPIYTVNMFETFNGLFGSIIGSYFRGYRINDVFEFLIAAISDNKVSFQSTYLTQTSVWQQKELFIFDGLAMVNENTDPNMAISFFELFNEVFKARNVSFYIDMSNPSAPVLRLENAGYFYNQSTVYEFDDLKDVITSFKPSKLYGTINVGSEYTVNGSAPAYNFPEGISYFGFKKETYTPLGQCNTDLELDLVNKFIISSNAINDQLVGVIDANLEEIFMVECEDVDTGTQEAEASQYPGYNGAPPYFYNLGLTNAKKLPIHGSNFQSALTNTLEIGGNGFRASLGFQEVLGIQSAPGNPVNWPGFTFDFNNGNEVSVLPIEYADEFGGDNYDGGNNYTNSGANAGQYLVPSDGTYSFAARSEIDVVNLKTCDSNTSIFIPSTVPGYPPAGQYANATISFGVGVRITLEAYTDNTLTTLIDSQSVFGNTLINGTYILNCSLATQLVAGNVVVVKSESWLYRYVTNLYNAIGQLVNFTGIVPMNWILGNGCFYSSGEPKIAIYLLEDSYFECNGTPDGATIIANNDPELYNILQHQFTYDIAVSDFQRILANPIGLFPFTKDGVTRNGWIESMTHNNFTGRTNVTLITSDATLP